MRFFPFFLGLLLLVATHQFARAEGFVCSADPRIVDPCFWTTGNLRIYANLRLYLSPDKTGRRYAIAPTSDKPDAKDFMPQLLSDMIMPSRSVHGRFFVCPFTHDIQGHMRTVCIDKAENVQPLTNETSRPYQTIRKPPVVHNSSFHEAQTTPERILDDALKSEGRKDLVFALMRGLPQNRASRSSFSEALVTAWKNANQKLLDQECGGHEIKGELCGFDYDPFLCAQDDNDGHFAFQTEREDAQNAIVSMQWVGDKAGRVLATYRLVKTSHNGRWVVDGVACKNGDQFNMQPE